MENKLMGSDLLFNFAQEANTQGFDIFARQYQQMGIECKIKEFTDCVKKIKIMESIDYNNHVVLDSMTGATISESDIAAYGYTHKWSDYKILENEQEFLSVVSIDVKHLQDAKFDVINRTIQCLVNSFGYAIEKYIVKNSRRPKGPVVWGMGTVVSPEIHYKYQNSPVSLLLKDNEILTNLNKYPPCYAITQDCIDVRIEGGRLEFVGKVKIAFSEETFTLFEVEDVQEN